MRRMYLTVSCVLAALWMIVSAPVAAQSTRPTIAVLNLDYGTIQPDTILGEATEAAVKGTAAKLIAAKSRLQ